MNLATNVAAAVRNPGTLVSGGSVSISSVGLAIIWRKINNIKFYLIYCPNRMMGIKIQFGTKCYIFINIHCNCVYDNTDSLIEYKFV